MESTQRLPRINSATQNRHWPDLLYANEALARPTIPKDRYWPDRTDFGQTEQTLPFMARPNRLWPPLARLNRLSPDHWTDRTEPWPDRCPDYRPDRCADRGPDRTDPMSDRCPDRRSDPCPYHWPDRTDFWPDRFPEHPVVFLTISLILVVGIWPFCVLKREDCVPFLCPWLL